MALRAIHGALFFANAALEASGVSGTRSASSQSFRHDPKFVRLGGAAIGAIAVFWRGRKKYSGLRHVGFYAGETDTHVKTLGGSEGEMVQIKLLPKSSGSFGLIDYWWSRSVPLATIDSATKADAPAPATQTKIVATMFIWKFLWVGGGMILAAFVAFKTF